MQTYNFLLSETRVRPPSTTHPPQLLDLVEGFARAALGPAAVQRIDASTRSRARYDMIQAFKQPSSPVRLFLMTVRSCGLGTDLPRVDTALLFDSDWHPQLDLQVRLRGGGRMIKGRHEGGLG